MQLSVIKRSGATEPFTREKAIAGVRKACKGRPVTEDDLACSASRSRTRCAASGLAEVAGPRGRHGHPAAAARARRGGLPAVRDASTGPSSPPRTSRTRSRCCAPSARSTARPPSTRRARRDPAYEKAADRPPERTTGGSGRPAAPPVGAERVDNQQATLTRRRQGMTETVAADSHRWSGRRGRAKGLTIERVFSTAGVHPYDELTWERRDVVQTELEDRRDRLRAARRGVPRLLVGQRLDDRHHEVLPRRGRHRRPRVEPQAAHRPGREDLPQGRRGPRLLRDAEPTPRSSSTS